MQFYVYGIDADGVEGRLDELGEAHWAYMDRFAAQLVARGPMLSPDGAAHSGSIHIVATSNLAAARRFALEEPYARAGLYSDVTVTPWFNALGGTMWDRPAASADTASTVVIARWPARACAPNGRDTSWRALTDPIAAEELVFGGLLLDEDARDSVGMVFALDRDLPDTERLVQALDCAPTTISRWCRGGRREA